MSYSPNEYPPVNPTNVSPLANPPNGYQAGNVPVRAPTFKAKYKENYGESLTVDVGANRMLNISTDCLIDDVSITKEVSKDIAFFGAVSQIIKFVLDEQYKDNFMYAIYCIPAANASEIRIVYVLEKEYGKAAMIVKLKTEGGLVTPGKQSNGKLANRLVDRFNLSDKMEIELPYFNGWENDKYYYFSGDYQPDITSPYLNNILVLDEKLSTDHALHIVFDTIKKNANSLMLFMLMTYGILHSVISEKGYCIKRLINLSGEMADKAAQFIKVFNKDDAGFIGLNNNLPSIKKAVFNAKDMPVIFKGRPENSKLRLLIDIYCNDIRPGITINGKHFSVAAKSLCVIISDQMSELVSADIIWEFNIEKWNGDIDVPAFGVAVKYLMEQAEKYVKENRFHEIIEKHSEHLTDDFTESERQEIAILSTIYEFLAESFMLYGLDINELISENNSSAFITEFVLNANNTTCEEAIINKIFRILLYTIAYKDAARYTSGMTINDESLILYDRTTIYMRYKKFKNICQKYFHDSITTSRLLFILKDYDALRSNNGNYMRLTVQTGEDKSDRSEWIGIKRSFLEDSIPFPLFPESDDVIDDIRNAIYIADIPDIKKMLLPVNNSAVANNHIGITGTSGMGKSNATLHLIGELLKKDIPVIIADSANSLNKDISSEKFRNMAGEKLNIISVRNDRLKLSPFTKRLKKLKGNFVPETTFDVMLRGSNTLADAFDLNETQKRYIQQITEPLIESGEASLKSICEELKTDNTNRQTAQACLNKLYTLMKADIFDESGETIDWQNYMTSGSVTYFSMEDIPDESFKRAIGEFILSDIWTYAQQYGDKTKPVAIIFDEVSNFAISSNSALTKMLKEGRKYGIMCIWNTQSFCTKFNDEQRATLSQASTMLFFDTAEPKEIE